ncbi:MAG TPA: efflux RND transporter periplasmic adaptor subunit [Bryobacteraceae bacterium]|nr:efflux RND transporter periplasmic adaptor subunit [Bryobacteraceae bacterium]
MSVTAVIQLGCQAKTAPTVASSDPALKVVTVKPARLRRLVRSNGIVQAINAMTIRVPRIEGQGGDVTVTKLIPGGTAVKPGDVLAEFDRTKQQEKALEAQAKYEDLLHQVEQRQAQHHADAEKRAADLQQARADLAKAELELRKGPILSEIDRLKNQAKLEDARAHVASLERSGHFHELAEAADLKILELQRDRQKLAWDRAQSNSEKLVIKATIPGMVTRENVWRNDSFGPAQEGDQIWPGEPLLRIFDPSDMEVQVTVGEPDGAALGEGSQATVRLDAYPALTFKAHFDSAGPVASALLDSDVKSFPARFRLDDRDPHLLPDLSAAVDLEVISKQPALLVPRGAIHYREGKPYVTRLTAPDRQEERAVELGGFNDTWVEITSGLKEGDRILSPVAPQPDLGEKRG